MIHRKDIPPEILAVANQARFIVPSGLTMDEMAVWCSPAAAIVGAYAIMAEREANAQVAESRVATSNTQDVGLAQQEAAAAKAANDIADAIRKRGEG